MASASTSKSPLICKYCGKLYKQSASLSQHERRHTGTATYNCCGKQFFSNATLKRHQCSSHGMNKSYVCVKCGKSFSTGSDLKRHERRENRELKVKCEICGYKEEDVSKMKDHMSKHTGSRCHTCRLCGKSYKYTSGLSRHTKEKHWYMMITFDFWSITIVTYGFFLIIFFLFSVKSKAQTRVCDIFSLSYIDYMSCVQGMITFWIMVFFYMIVIKIVISYICLK